MIKDLIHTVVCHWELFIPHYYGFFWYSRVMCVCMVCGGSVCVLYSSIQIALIYTYIYTHYPLQRIRSSLQLSILATLDILYGACTISTLLCFSYTHNVAAGMRACPVCFRHHTVWRRECVRITHTSYLMNTFELTSFCRPSLNDIQNRTCIHYTHTSLCLSQLKPRVSNICMLIVKHTLQTYGHVFHL